MVFLFTLLNYKDDARSHKHKYITFTIQIIQTRRDTESQNRTYINTIWQAREHGKEDNDQPRHQSVLLMLKITTAG